MAGGVLTTVALLHTVVSLPAVFTDLLAERAPGLRAFHIVDESLLADTIAAGMLPETERRVAAYAGFAAGSGADALLVTCSSIGEAAERARPRVGIPVLRVDEAMAAAAVDAGPTIGVLATLESTLGPTSRLIERTAEERGVERAVLVDLCAGAFAALMAGDRAEHDRLVSAGAKRLAGEADVLVLAQASMAQVVPAETLDIPVLSSPAGAVDALVAKVRA
jgi:Asp/Glu/hydantoin racemase